MSDGRYSRNVALFGEEGQRRIGETKIAVVGLGGLGCHVAQQLAYLGTVDVALIDGDVVTESSLNRVVGATPADVDTTTKVDVAARGIMAAQTDAAVTKVKGWLKSPDGIAAVQRADAVFACVDQDVHRVELMEIAIAAGVPYFDLATDVNDDDGLVYGGRVLFSGQGERCPYCMDILDQRALARAAMNEDMLKADERIYGVHRNVLGGTGPAVISLNGVVASLAVTEFMVWKTELRPPQATLTYRAETGIVRTTRDIPFEGCPYCARWPR
jgi:hypothetical protein